MNFRINTTTTTTTKPQNCELVYFILSLLDLVSHAGLGFFYFSLIICVYHGAHVKVREQHFGISSPLHLL